MFANAARPFDAPAARLLSASGDYGPLLLLESADGVPRALAPTSATSSPPTAAPQFQPVHGVVQSRLADRRRSERSRCVTQAEIDSMLEISPRHVSSEEEPSAAPAE